MKLNEGWRKWSEIKWTFTEFERNGVKFHENSPEIKWKYTVLGKKPVGGNRRDVSQGEDTV